MDMVVQAMAESAGTFLELSGSQATVVVALISAVATYLVAVKTAKQESRRDIFAQMQAWTEVQLSERDGRIDALEEEIAEVRREASTWRQLLWKAIDHIIDQRRIMPGDTEIPATDTDLSDMIMDRTISRRSRGGTEGGSHDDC